SSGGRRLAVRARTGRAGVQDGRARPSQNQRNPPVRVVGVRGGTCPSSSQRARRVASRPPRDPATRSTAFEGAPMDVLRAPDDRFASLPEFSFAPHYIDVPDGEGGRLRVHYLDEGPPSAGAVLLMHGEPSWCFLYRTMIPILVGAGLRVIAPDLVGFGRSDKPAARDDYKYQRH